MSVRQSKKPYLGVNRKWTFHAVSSEVSTETGQVQLQLSLLRGYEPHHVVTAGPAVVVEVHGTLNDDRLVR